MQIRISFAIVLSWILIILPLTFSSTISTLERGSSLSPSKDVVISSQNEKFSAGFYSVGDNAYCFAIWFTHEMSDGKNTIVWMANREQPVNGKQSKFSLLKSGELVLFDAGDLLVWTSGTILNDGNLVFLKLQDDGNLVLSSTSGKLYWQSFDSPTNTILPGQIFTRKMKLVSSRSSTNFSSGFYSLFFDNDNVLRLLYDGPDITSIFWPLPWLNAFDAGRTTYNNSKVAVLESVGNFVASDLLNFTCSDYGLGPQRRLTLDVDGNLRIYSLDKDGRRWIVTWQAFSRPCMVHGTCGGNSLCLYDHESGRGCSCVPGYKMKNKRDWSEGCVPEFKAFSKDATFVQIKHVEYYGYDVGYFANYTYNQCVDACLSESRCKGFQFKYDSGNGYFSCYPKNLLYNGYQSVHFEHPVFIRLPGKNQTIYEEPSTIREFDGCGPMENVTLERVYYRKSSHGWLKPLILATSMIGAFEIICLVIFLAKTRLRSNSALGVYLQVATGFQKFSFAELKKATQNFSQEIGRGGGGIVYKGKLSDNRIAAIKGLAEANQGQAEFLAEVSTIGRLNHMNLIDIWGHCAEGKHRFLVYEYMEHGSLAENLYSNKLDWQKRYEIALGTAKALAYLHEECLEWVLHCDVKPENILLDSNYQPKVADFGLSKLLNRSGIDNSKFSHMRGTRGYMAPEWVYDLPITSKVDVYSYGIVVLELITGRNPMATLANSNSGSSAVEQTRLVSWVREKLQGGSSIDEIVDPALNGEFVVDQMEILLKVALQCSEEQGDTRPTMSQVVHKLLHHGIDDNNTKHDKNNASHSANFFPFLKNLAIS